MLFREAIKIGYYDLQNARNEYRKVVTGQGLPPSDDKFEGMHLELVRKFARVQALLLAPITPHWSESIWLDILQDPKSIMHAKWPESAAPDHSLLSSKKYVVDTISRIRSAEDSLAKKKKKGKGAPAATGPSGPAALTLYVASKYPSWQEDVIQILRKCYDGTAFSGEKEAVKAAGMEKDKRVMPFLSMFKV